MIPWGTVANKVALSMGFPRQEYWSGLPFPSPGDLPDPGIEPMSPAFAGKFFTTEQPGKLQNVSTYYQIHANRNCIKKSHRKEIERMTRI